MTESLQNSASLNVSRLRDLAISDTGFVFDAKTGYTYSANGTAVTAIRWLKDGSSPGDIVARLASEFEVDPLDDLVRDVEELVARLREHGLVR
jgi:Coenzyme PQQ synthesis protein D (PqqD)